MKLTVFRFDSSGSYNSISGLRYVHLPHPGPEFHSILWCCYKATIFPIFVYSIAISKFYKGTGNC